MPQALENALAQLNIAQRTHRYRKGEVILSQGDPANYICMVLEGTVKVTVVSDHGKEAVIGMMHASDFLGEECMIDQPRRLSTAMAISNVTVSKIDRMDAQKAFKLSPAFSHCFLLFLVSRKSRLEEDLVDQIFNSSEKRLARILLTLADERPGDSAYTTIPKVSQETLASMVGTTRSRISYFMNRFKKWGLIKYNKGIEVNPALVRVLLLERPLVDRGIVVPRPPASETVVAGAIPAYACK
jgi:CRP/FNR family cyclic AMP-dependent transcriptional regulator